MRVRCRQHARAPALSGSRNLGFFQLPAGRLHTEKLAGGRVQDGPEKKACENRSESQRDPIRGAGTLNQPHGRAPASKKSKPCYARAGIGRLGEREVIGIAWPRESATNARRLAIRGHDESSRPCAVRGGNLGEPEPRREETRRLCVPRVDVDREIGALRKHNERSTTRRSPVSSATWRGLGSRRFMLAVADAHCHLDPHHFGEGPEAVIERARAAGVIGFVVVGLAGPSPGSQDELEPARFAVNLARRDPSRVAACVGLHPHDANAYSEPLGDSLRALAVAPEVVAVGEMGLDYHYDHSPREKQREVFARLVAIAREVGKPIVVHTRSAAQDTLAILEGEGAREVGGIIHCFSEDRAFASRALDLNFDVSFSGIVTFKNARSVQEVAAWAPKDRILVETDSPYLAPVPLRGQKCEPAHVVHTVRFVAQLRAIPVDELAALTLANTERRFAKRFAQSDVVS